MAPSTAIQTSQGDATRRNEKLATATDNAAINPRPSRPAARSIAPPRRFQPHLNNVKIFIERHLNGVKMKRSKPAGRAPARRLARRAPRNYHHGALRAALVAATEDLLLEEGVAGFTLRKAARRVGVSPSAPAHHFGDAAGLLSEVATLGFEEFALTLREADERGGADPAR